MITLDLNINHDLHLDRLGNLATAADLRAVMQNCKTAALTQYSEMQFAATSGVNYKQSLQDSVSIESFEASMRKTLEDVAGVEEITEFNVTRQGDALHYEAIIKTIFGIDKLAG